MTNTAGMNVAATSKNRTMRSSMGWEEMDEIARGVYLRRLVSAARPRRGVTRLHGISARRPRRPPRRVAAEYPRGGRGGAATRYRAIIRVAGAAATPR